MKDGLEREIAQGAASPFETAIEKMSAADQNRTCRNRCQRSSDAMNLKGRSRPSCFEDAFPRISGSCSVFRWRLRCCCLTYRARFRALFVSVFIAEPLITLN